MHVSLGIFNRKPNRNNWNRNRKTDPYSVLACEKSKEPSKFRFLLSGNRINQNTWIVIHLLVFYNVWFICDISYWISMYLCYYIVVVLLSILLSKIEVLLHKLTLKLYFFGCINICWKSSVRTGTEPK
jgi:hypothetical protein